MIYANPFVRAAPPVSKRIPVMGRRFSFVNAEQLVNAESQRLARATRAPVQRNYSLTQGQAIAIAENNRKIVLQGGPLPAYRVPTELRNRYHPNSTDLTAPGLGVLPFLPVGLTVTKTAVLPVIGGVLKALPVVGSLFGSHHTPEQKAATATKIISALAPRLTAPRVKLPPILKTPVASVPTVVQGPSSSGEFYNAPAELEPVQRSTPNTVSIPQVDAGAVNQASIMGGPPWLLPVIIGGAALFFFSQKKR